MDDELFKNLVGKIVDKGKQNDILHPDVPDKEKMIEALFICIFHRPNKRGRKRFIWGGIFLCQGIY